jgi:transposase-like protein
MARKSSGSAASQRARRALQEAAQVGGDERGRFSSKRKTESVLRLLRGESLEHVSRELGVTAATLSSWREQFLASGQVGLKTRVADEQEEELRRLRSKVGELMMENELLYERCHRLEDGLPLAQRRRRP